MNPEKTSILNSQRGPGLKNKVLSPAKINLFLHISGKRDDGYHEIMSHISPVSLWDEIFFKFNKPEIKISCSHALVPENEKNLAWQAARIFFEKTGIKKGVFISIDKNIPVGAGLGGGSSNSAFVLKALNEHYGRPLSKKELMKAGLEIGSDVPFFISCKPAIATGRGEILSPVKKLLKYKVILVQFDFHVSTAHVYKKLNLALTKCEKINKHSHFNGSKFDPALHLCNDLETVTAAEHPVIEDAKRYLIDNGAKGALMSGSGPTVFGLFSSQKRAEGALRALKERKGVKPCLVEMI